MKRLITALIILVMVLTSCDNGNDNEDGSDNVNKTTLTVINMNFLGYCEVAYGDVNFDLVHNDEETKTVSSGARYAYITNHYFTEAEYYAGLILAMHNLTCKCPVFRTETITCEEGKNTEFGLTKNTVVTLISGFGYDKFGDTTGTIESIAGNIDDYYLENERLKTRGFNAIQTWFWDAVESFNNAPDGTTQTITLTNSLEFPSVSRTYAGSTHYSLFIEGQSNKKLIIQGDSVERTISNSGKILDGFNQLEASGSLFSIPNGITLELGNNITLNGNNVHWPVVEVEEGGAFIMNNGSTVKGANDCGVVVKGTFTMNGGTISGNKYGPHPYWGTSSGGGVVVQSGEFTMTGGIIKNNANFDSWYGGGGVSVVKGTLNMSGGTISGNTSDPDPSGFLMDQSGNHISRGGGVFVGIDGSFIKTGGTIDDTNSAYMGKVVYAISNGIKGRDSTAGPNDNVNSTIAGADGGWEWQSINDLIRRK